MKVNGAGANGLLVEAEIVDRDSGKVIGTATGKVVGGEANLETKVASPKLWYADSPALYDVKLKLKHAVLLRIPLI